MKKNLLIACLFIFCACEQEEDISISFEQSNLELNINETTTIIATISPSDALVDSINWSSSDNSVATILLATGTKGVIIGKDEGNCTITASVNNKTASCMVTVHKVYVSSITLNKPSLELIEQESATLVATIAPGNASDKTIIWESSNPEIASVQNGIVTGIKPGEAIITATSGEKSDSCIVTVNKRLIPAKSISIDNTTYLIWKGTSEMIEATVYPDYSTDSITWTSSNNSIVQVNNDGIITAINEGEATITVQAGSVTASRKVKVGICVDSIILDKTQISLEDGQFTTISATISPDHVTNLSVEWKSSDENIAQVNSTGKVTGIDEGTATILIIATSTLKDNGTTITRSWSSEARCLITVNKIPIESVSLDETNISLEKGQTKTLVATITPDNTNKPIKWTSSDENVVKVVNIGQNGIITAKGKGEATITAQVGDKSASCKVTVTVPVQSITLDKTYLSLNKGQSTTLVATVTPNDASNKTIKWTSSDESIVKVDQNGKVTAVNKGQANITVQAEEKTATCKVTVTIPIESITLDKQKDTLNVGDEITLTPTISPSDATYTSNDIKWSSSNIGVATVVNGTVKAVGIGTTTITISIGNVSATCSITVFVDSHEGVSAKYYGGSMSILNGLMLSGSQLNFGVVNNSCETITVVSAQLIDGETHQAGNVMEIGADINPGSSKAWTITIGPAGIHSPKIRFVYTFKGEEYSCEAAYTPPTFPNINW